MNREEFNKMYMCEFIPDQRQINLDEALMDYNNKTLECDNKIARKHWDIFLLWCGARGYTYEEINQAKLRCQRS